MTDIKRNIYTDLDIWLNALERKPLLIRGARQVGKSYAVRTWASRHRKVEHFVELNLEQRTSGKEIFEGDLKVDRLLRELQLFTGASLREPGTLLFIDEIQNAPRAITALRYFYEEMPELPLIAAGSLVDFALEQLSFPVGRVHQIPMFPLCFYEFVAAVDGEVTAEFIQSCSLNESVPESVHQKLLDLLKQYYLVGGMPEAVSQYIKTQDLARVSDVHEQLLLSFKDDFLKYAKKNEIEPLRVTLEKAPYLVGDCRVKYVNIDRSIHSDKLKNALSLCEKANLISRVISTYSSKLPLGAGADRKFFKLLFLDIGLLHHSLGFNWTEVEPGADLTNIHDGSFAEQFVGQELLATFGTVNQRNLYYWYRKEKGSDAEVDYIVPNQGTPCPVEVKSRHRGSLKSLTMYIQKFKPAGAFVLSQRNVETLTDTKLLPLYLASRVGGTL